MVKYGIINLTANCQPYTYFDDIKKKYYDSKNVTYKYVYNEPKIRHIEKYEMLYVSECFHPSGVPVMLEKFFWAIKELLIDPDWSSCDYFIRTNSSTFLNLEILEAILKKMPKRRCYAGPVIFNRLISGTCIVFSRDVIKYLSRIKIGNEKNKFDDLVIAQYMRRRLIKMRDIQMSFFADNKIHSVESIRQTLSVSPLIRVKNDENRMLYDIDIWQKMASIKEISIKNTSNLLREE